MTDWLKRVAKFTAQMFPVYPNMIGVTAGFVVNYLILARVFFRVEVSLQDVILGGLGFLLFVYLLRVFDEIKDLPTDKINFPDRPLVSGVLNEKDLRGLIGIITGLLLVIHVPYVQSSVLPAFLIVLGYSFLSFKWFFAEGLIRPSLPLALVTHNPLVYLYQLYTLSFFGSFENLPTIAIVFMIGEGMGGTAWEISRKIRGTTEEDNYVTYSRLWGRKIPQAITSLIVLVSLILTYVTVAEMATNPLVKFAWFVPGAVTVWLIQQSIAFALKPNKAPKFRVMVETYKMALFVAMIVAIVLQ